jgi:hypothetical protein
MSRPKDYVFVLWGDKFEETTAATFITELRKAGLLVKLVSLNSRQIRGAQGLALIPDLTLGQALPLAVNAICVIIPYTSPDLKQLKNDPRLCEFFSQACANKAKFVIRPLNETAIAELGLFPVDNMVVYPEGGDLVGFVRELGSLLLKTGSLAK